MADPITIQDTLSQLQSMLQADLIMITDAEGNTTAEILEGSYKTKQNSQASIYPIIKNSIEKGELGADLILSNNTLYLVACHSISFDGNIGGSVLVGKPSKIDSLHF